MDEFYKTPEQEVVKPLPEKGVYVGGVISFIRHGVREKTGELKEEGRVRTREIGAREAVRPGSILSINADLVRVIGSDAGPKGSTGQQRSLETAHILGETLSQEGRGDFDQQSAPSKLLSYATLKYEAPYDHEGIYNKVYDEEIAKGSDVHTATERAQDATIDASFAAQGEAADKFRLEVAGSFSVLVEEFIEKLKNAKSGTTVLMPAGTHGGTMEYLLQQALIWEDENGVHGPGFLKIGDIGGAFQASEGYNVEIDTDRFGKLSEVNITFQDKERRKGIYNARLDMEKVKIAADFYRKEHPELPESGLNKIII